MKTCFLFPGQGAQYPGMGRDLWENSEKVRDIFSLASDKTGIDCEKLIFEGTEDDLKATDNTQVAITVVNVATATILRERGLHPDGAAGFSLGEYSALHEAGVLALEDLFPIVRTRGELMEQASRRLDSQSGNPGMAAVIGLTYEQVTRAAADLSDVYPANYNSPTQVVISGTFAGLTQAETALKEAGARRFIRLKVSGPFHSPLLKEAADGLKAALAGYTFSDPVLPVYANVSGGRLTSGEEARDLCVRQVLSTVKWVDEERNLLSDGFDRLLEVGPGTVLTGLWKHIDKDNPCLPCGKLDAVNQITEA